MNRNLSCDKKLFLKVAYRCKRTGNLSLLGMTGFISVEDDCCIPVQSIISDWDTETYFLTIPTICHVHRYFWEAMGGKNVIKTQKLVWGFGWLVS